jgi:hypothetical protein
MAGKIRAADAAARGEEARGNDIPSLGRTVILFYDWWTCVKVYWYWFLFIFAWSLKIDATDTNYLHASN